MWHSHWLPYLLAPPSALAGAVIGDDAAGTFLLGCGGLLAVDAAAWLKAAFSAEDFSPDMDWLTVWYDAYSARSAAIRWAFLAVMAAMLAALRHSQAPEELFLLIMLPLGAYALTAVLIFRKDITRYAQRVGIEPPVREDGGEVRFDTTGQKDR